MRVPSHSLYAISSLSLSSSDRQHEELEDLGEGGRVESVHLGEESVELRVGGGVGRVARRRIAVHRLVDDGLRVREGLVTELAVVVSVAARADAAEREVRVGKMRHDIIHGDSAAAGATQDVVVERRLRAEDVERERLRLRVDVGNHLLDVVVRQDGEDRT